MAKIIKDTELADIIRRIIEDNEIDDAKTYADFLNDLATLITDYCGGEFASVGVVLDENVPDDSGIWKHYDTDVTWKDGEEVQT